MWKKGLMILPIILFLLVSCGKKEEISLENKSNSVVENTEDIVMEDRMYIYINDSRLEVLLADNSSAKELLKHLKENDITLELEDYAHFEKSGDLGFSLPRNDSSIHTESGDIILYLGRTFVIYYDENDWSLTRLGKIQNADANELKKILGEGNVTVRLSVK